MLFSKAFFCVLLVFYFDNVLIVHMPVNDYKVRPLFNVTVMANNNEPLGFISVPLLATETLVSLIEVTSNNWWHLHSMPINKITAFLKNKSIAIYENAHYTKNICKCDTYCRKKRVNMSEKFSNGSLNLKQKQTKRQVNVESFYCWSLSLVNAQFRNETNILVYWWKQHAFWCAFSTCGPISRFQISHL